MSVAEQAKAQEGYIVSMRREFHSHPEVSLHEFRTAQRIEEELDKLSIPHKRCGETGVYAELKGEQPGDGVIVLRADIDALPVTETHETVYQSQNVGVMHACGHDSHAACLLGAAQILAAEKANFGGTVRFFFQPAEEVGAGAKEFIRDGLLDGVERAFGIHAASDLPVGTVGITAGPNNAAVDYFKITVHGINAHVSTPQKGADALYIASQIVVAVQALATRLHSPTEPLIIGIGKLVAGTAYNIVAGEAVIEGTTRTLTPETRASIQQQITALTQQTALLYGGTAETEWVDYTPPLINPADICEEVTAQAEEIPGVTVCTNRPVSLGGDNFAEFQQFVPGVYAYLGTHDLSQPNTGLPHHNDGFDIGEKSLVYGTALYAQYALWWLTEGREA